MNQEEALAAGCRAMMATGQMSVLVPSVFTEGVRAYLNGRLDESLCECGPHPHLICGRHAALALRADFGDSE